MTPKTKYKKADIAAALEQTGGCISLAANNLKISRQSIYRYIQRWPALREVVDDQTEQRLDEAEVSLRAAVLKGEAWAICFFLKTRGKSRGYTEKTEHEHSGAVHSGPVKLEIEVVEDVRKKNPAPPNPG